MNKHPRSERLSRRMVVASALAVLTFNPVFVFSVDEPGDELDPVVLEEFRGLRRHMGRLDWESQYPLIESAITNIWQRHGWKDEADHFARDTACKIAAVPPWEPVKRLNLLAERMEQRYGLSGEKAARFRTAVMREAAGFLMRNIGVILEQTGDGMDARLQGEPFTAEQIARWAKESQPLLAELRRRADRLAKELEPILEPARRQILRRDLKNFRKRQRVIDRMTARWVRGEWQPADWGLQNDPIQSVGPPAGRPDPPPLATRSPSIRETGKPPTIGRWLPHDPSTWHNYALDFQKRFDLNAGQMSTAESIHVELLTRGDRYIEAHTDILKTIPLAKRITHEAYEPVRSLFREFQSRLDAIPTSGQRERGKR